MQLMAFLRTLFLVRVPIVFLAAVGAVAAFSYSNPVLQGLFTVRGGLNFGLVALAASLVGLGATSSINLILEHGRERMDATPAISEGYPARRPSAWVYGLCMAAPLLFIGFCARWSMLGFLSTAAAVMFGGGLAHVLAFVATAIEIWFADASSGFPNMLILPLPIAWTRPGGWMWLLLQNDAPGSTRIRTFLDNMAEFSHDYAGPLLRGYLYKRDGYKFYPGMVFNAAFFAIAVLTWFLCIRHGDLDQPLRPLSSLAFVMLAFLVLMLLFSGIAYFFDRYRIPLSGITLIYFLLIGSSSGTDHFYRVAAGKVCDYPRPSDILNTRKRAVIVMAAGGGIQAAAWMTRTLWGLENEFPGFENHIALISSVSGGSLGAYYTAVAQHTGKKARDAALWALKPALDEVAWGWMGPDLFRVFFPYAWKPEIDRGWALETTWDRITGSKDLFVSDLADDARRTAPAYIFNASVIEEGSPFVITNTAFPRGNQRAASRKVKEFNCIYHNQKIRVSTAARLSASFPFVAPAARSDAHPLGPDYHLVDGGYYDNFGILSAIDWLDQAINNEGAEPERVALIEIRQGDPSNASGSMRGWNYQLSAPLGAVLKIREKEQLPEGQVALDSFVKQNPKVQFRRFEFVYHGKCGCDKQPDSWKFTRAQADCINRAWPQQEALAKQVVEFLQ